MERCIRQKDAKDDTTIGKTKRTGDTHLDQNKPAVEAEPPPPIDLDDYRGDKSVCVKTIAGKPNAIQYGEEATILHVKYFIEEEMGIPFSKQRLVFSGKILENHMSMASLNVSKESTIHLIIKSP